MEHLSREVSPSHATPKEAYEQDFYELLELAGIFHARLSANYRTEQPRTAAHVAKLEAMKAMLQDLIDFARA